MRDTTADVTNWKTQYYQHELTDQPETTVAVTNLTKERSKHPKASISESTIIH